MCNLVIFRSGKFVSPRRNYVFRFLLGAPDFGALSLLASAAPSAASGCNFDCLRFLVLASFVGVVAAATVTLAPAVGAGAGAGAGACAGTGRTLVTRAPCGICGASMSTGDEFGVCLIIMSGDAP